MSLSHKKGPEIAGPPIHLHSGRVADRDEEAVRWLEEGRPSLMEGEQPGLLSTGPAHTPRRLHQENGHSVGAHLFVDVLDQLRSLLHPGLHQVSLALCLCFPSGGQSEVRLGVDVVKSSSWHQQLSSLQLHVLQEGQTALTLPRTDTLPQVTLTAAASASRAF